MGTPDGARAFGGATNGDPHVAGYFILYEGTLGNFTSHVRIPVIVIASSGHRDHRFR